MATREELEERLVGSYHNVLYSHDPSPEREMLAKVLQARDAELAAILADLDARKADKAEPAPVPLSAPGQPRLRFGYYPIAAEQAATRTEARGKDGK